MCQGTNKYGTNQYNITVFGGWGVGGLWGFEGCGFGGGVLVVLWEGFKGCGGFVGV